VNAFIGWYREHIKVSHPPRQEDRRLIIPHAGLKAHIMLMQAFITGKFSSRVFNLEEVRCSPRDDRKPGKLIGRVTVSAGRFEWL
jgi:hypothetical protein